MTPIQAAIVIQRAWRRWRHCPYCLEETCEGYLSQFNCRFMWSEYELYKLDRQLDGDYW